MDDKSFEAEFSAEPSANFKAKSSGNFGADFAAKPGAGKKVFVGMSGGVDSSVAAMLLIDQGYDVTGVYMKNWSRDLPGMKCPWAEDLADAKRVAVRLGIDFQVWDFEKEYREKVVDYMLSEFRAGRTPNPDVMCNQEIKFKLFFEKAMKRGADFIATGHYAQIEHKPQMEATRVLRNMKTWLKSGSGACPEDTQSLSFGAISAPANLLRATDENKDQTYFLYRMSEKALAKTLFPVGGMLKPEVKKLAEKRGLHNAYKKESMGVCFVGEVGMKDFLKEYIAAQPGEIREIEGEKIVGAHEGAVFYTLGQRHGLYLSGEAGEVNDGLPYYVVKKDLTRNIVYVSKNLERGELWARELELEQVFLREAGKELILGAGSDFDTNSSVTADEVSASKITDNRGEILVRLRHRAELIPAKVEVLGDGKNGEFSGRIIFSEKVRRPAAGQSAVFYSGRICLGGGIIAE